MIMTIPKDQNLCMTYTEQSTGKIYIVTRTLLNDFFLYEKVGDNDYKKLKKANNPFEFKQVYPERNNG